MNDDKNVRQFEGEVYFPSPEVIERTHCKDYDSMYKRSIEEIGRASCRERVYVLV